MTQNEVVEDVREISANMTQNEVVEAPMTQNEVVEYVSNTYATYATYVQAPMKGSYK